MNAEPPQVFIFSGEISGDMFGGNLLKSLKKQWPQINVSGVGGPVIRSEGISNVLRMEDFQVMGFSDVFSSLPRLWRQFSHVRDHILKTKPDIAIFVDSPSFSLRMARVLRKKGYSGKIIQYVSPTVWAWGKDRVSSMAKSFDLLLTIYPFEAEYFSQSSLKTIYVGNPLQEIIKTHSYHPTWKQLVDIKETDSVIALFPGSRQAEIKRHLPTLLKAAKMIHNRIPNLVFAISCSDENNMPLLQSILNQTLPTHSLNISFIPKKYSYELMKEAKTAIAKSGTVTLELALHACPTVVFYELTTLNKFIAQYVLKVKLPFYCIVNILAKKKVFPELIETRCTPENVFENFLSLHQNGTQRESCLVACASIKALFEKDNASDSAAKAIVAL